MLLLPNGRHRCTRWQNRFQQAVKGGELPRGTDTEQLARFYGAVIQGMSIQALDGAGPKALRGIAETALRAWPGVRNVKGGK
jgi:hypothetical protein